MGEFMLGDADYIKSQVRTIPDWPEPGVMFRDITPLFQDPRTLRIMVDLFVHRYIDQGLDYVVGFDARGFLIGPAIAYGLNIGFIPVRKKGKLPFRTLSQDYALEYGTGVLEIHADACLPGDRVLLFDDLIATGGTMMAGAQLLRRLGAEIVEAAAIIDLPDLGGADKLRDAGIKPFALCSFSGH
jgi:adenine phosphoribosyltransferase